MKDMTYKELNMLEANEGDDGNNENQASKGHNDCSVRVHFRTLVRSELDKGPRTRRSVLGRKGGSSG